MRLNRIKIILVDKGIFQTELADKLGRSFSIVNAYCCNHKQLSLEVLDEIAQHLSVDTQKMIVEKYERFAKQ